MFSFDCLTFTHTAEPHIVYTFQQVGFMRDAQCLCIYLFFLGFSRLSKCLKWCFLTFPHLFIHLDLHSRHELIIMSFKSDKRMDSFHR